MGAVMAAEAPVHATEETWAFPPADGWTFDQVRDLDLPFDWELVDGKIVVRGQPSVWHNRVRRKLANALDLAVTEPHTVDDETCVMLDPHNVRKPDVIVYDPTGLSLLETDCVPVAHLALAVEVVSPGSRSDDRILKPALFAQAKVPYYWRVERTREDRAVVHEYWLNAETRSYFPAPPHPVHREKLATDHPYPVQLDLTELTAGL
ncbi:MULTISPECIES: Uma2 family endonuclease [unclassified Streptomyces]|uniref:Uma2 family endonuclease n=1 Tax=unclassified Streptomyces TaxID=2593676 RepID=UPI000D1460F7|nr:MULTISPECIES: Uma2 family endonuclease [unclassified Streptomyces]